MTYKRGPASLLALVLVLALVSGCSNDEKPDDPEPGTSPRSHGSSSSSESSVPPTTEQPVQTVTSAAGPELRQAHLSVHAPEGWSVTKEADTITGFAQDDVLLSTLMIGELEDPNPGVSINLDEMARDSVKSGHYLRDPEILEPVEIDGVLWFHTSGQIDSAHYEDVFGTITDGVMLDITVTTLVDILSPREHQELVGSILASVDLDVD